MKVKFILLIFALPFIISAQVRIKDIAEINGLETKQLIGYGLVVGLDGTGDGSSSQMTAQSIKNMMERFGVTIPINKIRPNNIASVMVTANLEPFVKKGNNIDVTVSSIGDAKSLEGGTLLLTPLISVSGKQYASAQGPVSIGGFNSSGKLNKIRKNYTNVGRVPNGAVVEREISSGFIQDGQLILDLYESDFTVASRILDAINIKFGKRLAYSEDAGSIKINVPEKIKADNLLVDFVSQVENLTVKPEAKAKVVINERTGTIVAGGNVTVSEVAVSHGNLTIEISARENNLELGGLEYKETEEFVEAKSDPARVLVLEAATVAELAGALNSIKVTSRDLISIFQSLKVAGALQAELIIL
ncbi:MAG: flagellar biosynthesis protein FlgA [Candidatus Cloacimonadota bacterium]|nr:MAG: flagellar biosynthesis protein FlgA [Candidatus Cloacimonadota bacterium]